MQFAVAGAVAAHLLVAVAISWHIELLSIPAEQDRTLVLTLDSTPLDGIKQAESPAETVNDVPLGEPMDSATQAEAAPIKPAPMQPSPPPQAKELEIASDSGAKPITPAAAAPTQAAPTQAEPARTPPVKAEPMQVAPMQVAPMQVAPMQAAPMQVAQHIEQPEIDNVQPQMATIAETSDTALENEFVSLEMDALTQLESELQIVAQIQAKQVEQFVDRPVSDAQIKMIDQQIKLWSAQLDSLDGFAEPLTWKHQGQIYSASISHFSSGGEMDLEKVTVEVVTEQNGVSLTTELRLKKLAFSNFAQFVHRWDDDLLLHDDVLDGRFHSNSKIHLDVDSQVKPVFHGKVTTASQSIKFNRSGRFVPRDNVFLAGVETGVKKIEMPTADLLFTEFEPANQNNTFVFDQDTRIVFTANRQFHWHPLDDPSNFNSRPIGDQPVFLLGGKGVRLHVSGAVNGKVLVYSPRLILIESDLVYARHRGSSDGDSILGLVSAGNIAIAGNRITGPGDLEINAAIYAARRFLVRGSKHRHRSTLRIFGSLSAGSLSATEPRFATSIAFDPRLENTRPPRFPQTRVFELVGSDAIWTASVDDDTLAGEYPP